MSPPPGREAPSCEEMKPHLNAQAPCAPVPDWSESLSALVDGECRPHELDALLRDAARHPLQDSSWAAYQTLGAALRGAAAGPALLPSSAFAAAVMARLVAETEAEAGAPACAATRAAAPEASLMPGASSAPWWRWAAGLAVCAAASSLGWLWLDSPGAGQPELAQQTAPAQADDGGGTASVAESRPLPVVYEPSR